MKKSILQRAGVVSSLIILLGLSVFPQRNLITGRVIAIADGDTITLLDSQKKQIKIRLAGIDAPEFKQAFGNKSKQNLSRLIFGKTVKIETGKTDRYGRIVGKVIFDGRDINLEQIKNGMVGTIRNIKESRHAKIGIYIQDLNALQGSFSLVYGSMRSLRRLGSLDTAQASALARE